MQRAMTAAILLPWILFATNSSARACMGDADLDGKVHVGEIITLVDCALDRGQGCPEVWVDDVVQAVNNALRGCDSDPVRLTLIPCRQCDGCVDGFESILLGWTLGFPEDLLPDDVDVLEFTEVNPEIVCSACGCPGGPIYHVLVPGSQANRLIELGWTIDR